VVHVVAGVQISSVLLTVQEQLSSFVYKGETITALVQYNFVRIKRSNSDKPIVQYPRLYIYAYAHRCPKISNVYGYGPDLSHLTTTADAQNI
jgi:hypothetical protein